jgi:hypothetical protein
MEQTIWEKVTGTGPKKPSLVFNPLKIEVGKFVSLDDLDYRSLQFKVMRVSEYNREITGKTFLFTDYYLSETLSDAAGKNNVMLRYIPMTNPLPGMTQTNDVVLMTLHDEFGYSDDFLAVVNDPSKEFKITNEEGTVTEQYWRVNDIQNPYLAKVMSIAIESPEEFVTREVKYWDYWRESEDEANQKVLDFVYVEMDIDNGYFQIWKGKKVSPDIAQL